MATERIPCRGRGCNNTILPATAKANDGFCMPCVQKQRSEAREEYVRKNRREADPYAGITDVVEMLRLIHTPKSRDPLVVFRPPPKSAEELYLGLNAVDAGQLMQMAADAMDDGNEDLAESIAGSLATFTDYSLDNMLAAWIRNNHFRPPYMFRKAGATVRDGVVNALETGQAEAHRALDALAWIGDGKVEELFRRWESSPTPWKGSLFVGPASYAHNAGWELGDEGRRNLFYEKCWEIAPVASGATDQAARVMRGVSQQCPWCGRNMVHLIEVDLADARFGFLGNRGDKLNVLTCDACACYGGGFVFSRCAADGTARLAETNKRPAWLPADVKSHPPSPWKDVPVRLQARGAMHAVDWCRGPQMSFSQIGGLPGWVQEAAYPQCPDCMTTMKFIAQIDNGAFPYHEGIYYAFLCAGCKVTATTYQQS